MYNITADCMYYSQEGIWAINNKLRSIFRYNKTTRKIDYISELPNFIKSPTIEISISNDIIFLYPYWNKDMFLFNIKNKKWESIKINSILEKNPYIRYIKTINRYIYMYIIPTGVFMEINIDTYQIQYYDIPPKYIYKISSEDVKYVKNKFIFPMLYESAFLVFDIDSKKIYKKSLGKDLKGITTIAYKDSSLYISGKNNELIEWNIEAEKITREWQFCDTINQYLEQKKINIINKDNGDIFPFLKSLIVENKLWLFPYVSNMLLQIDLNTGICKEIDLLYVQNSKNENICRYLTTYPDSREIVIKNNTKLYIINSITAEIKQYNIILQEKQLYDILEGQVIEESEDISIINFLNLKKRGTSLNFLYDNNIGQKINNAISKKENKIKFILD